MWCKAVECVAFWLKDFGKEASRTVHTFVIYKYVSMDWEGYIAHQRKVVITVLKAEELIITKVLDGGLRVAEAFNSRLLYEFIYIWSSLNIVVHIT